MRIEDITKQNLEKASDLDLKRLNYKITKFWDRHFAGNSRDVVGCFTRVNFVAKYRMLLKEMNSSKRSLQHSTCDLDRAAFKQTMLIKRDGIDVASLDDLVLEPHFAFLNEDFAKSDEVMITIKAKESDEVVAFLEENRQMIEEVIGKSCHFVCDENASGNRIPLFSKVLRPVRKIEKVEIQTDKEEIEKDISIVPMEKSDKQIVYGIVYEPDTVDAQGDKANAEEIQKAAYEFMANVQAFKVMHKGKKVNVRILENYIAPVDFEISGRKVKKGSWMLVTKVLDKKLWKEIKAGNLTGYSMAGYARVE